MMMIVLQQHPSKLVFLQKKKAQVALQKKAKKHVIQASETNTA